MEEKDKICIKKIINQDRYNELDIEKTEAFLNNLQDIIVNIGLTEVTEGRYEFDGESYDVKTFYTLHYEDEKDDFQTKKRTINDFGNGEIARYYNNEIELLIVFLNNKIKLIFYCDLKNREKIIKALLKYGTTMNVSS